MRTRLALGVAASLMLTACTGPNTVGDTLGSIRYVVDKTTADVGLATTLHTGASIAALADRVQTLGDQQLAQRLRAVDSTGTVVVSLYFDACSKSGPSLQLAGAELTVRYAEELNRTCVRAIDTLTVFAIAKDRLPNPVTLAVCPTQGRVTLNGDTVTGQPARMC